MNRVKIKIVGKQGENLVNDNTTLSISSGILSSQRLDNDTVIGVWDVVGEGELVIHIDKLIPIP